MVHRGRGSKSRRFARRRALAERLRLVRLEAEEELRWEIARATGGTQAETNAVEATAEAAAVPHGRR